MAALHPETLLTGSTVDLSGDGWRLLGALPSAVDRPDGDGSPLGGDTGWIPASVPGSVQHDLRRAGLLDDLYVGRNTLAAEWAADRTWLYERAFEAPPEWRGSTVRLRLDRVDYAARFLLNGTPLGEHASIFTPAVFDVTDALAWEGENRLTVVLGPAPEEQDQMGRTSLVRTRKPRMGYWWDFCPRLVNLGLGGAVTLQRLPDARLEDVAVHPVLSTDAGRCDLRVEIDVDRGQGSPDRVRIEVDILSGKDRVAAVTAPVEAGSGRATVHLQLELTRPELWWPNGAGEQSMYRAEVRLATDSAVVDTRITAFGVRRIELVRNDTPDPDAPPYTFVINGRRIYITGWNWVPVDALYGVPRAEKLEHLLELAAAAHCNLLRVNGVGLIETAEFYEHCDRLGILVWQEFVLTSSATDRKPSEDAGYLAAVVDEALGIVRSRRNHPSLAVWCAGNELESLEKLPLDDSEPVIAALRQVATALDQDTVWLPTSARGRKPFNGLSSIRRDPDGLHDVHGPWLYEGLDAQYELYNAGTSLFHSELGAEAITNRETLHDVVPPAELTVAGMTGPTWRHLGAWWLRTDVWEQTFGVVDDLDKLVALTQFLQAEAVRYGVEANRRRAWRNSGSLPWQFDEPYPMVGSTAAVDYYGRPKPLYYAIAEAYAPVAVSARYDTLAWGGRARFSAELWVSSSLPAPVEGARLRARVLDASGAEVEGVTTTVTLVADGSTPLGTIGCPIGRIGTGVFFLDIQLADRDGEPLSTSRMCFSSAVDLVPLSRLPETRVTAAPAGGDGVILRNEGDQPAVGVRVADGGDVRASSQLRIADACFSLLPGEARTVRLAGGGGRSVGGDGRRLAISGINVTLFTASLDDG